jgi:queuine tRNA-ribosyltransferase
MCFDQCTHFPAEHEELHQAVERTISWAERSKAAHSNRGQLLFGIIQGGIDTELRAHCAGGIVKLGLDGYAIGGLSVGEGHEDMVRTVAHTTKLLPEHLPRYLMGVGTPIDIIAAVREGIDMFDCVLPTRNGRNGFAFTENGPVRLKNNAYISSTDPVDAGCDCYCCRNFSRGTLRHFFNCGEMLGSILLSIHNISFYQRLLVETRRSIERGDFTDWAARWMDRYRPGPDTEQSGMVSQ